MASWAAGEGIDYRHVPVSLGRVEDLIAAATEAASSAETAADILGSIYRRILDEHGATLAGVVDAMVDGLPAGFGCAAGKDRTGVLAALLQSLAGVDEAGIMEDYHRLAPDAERVRGMLRSSLTEVELHGPGVETLIGTPTRSCTTR